MVNALTVHGVTYEITKALGPADVSEAQRDMMQQHGKTRFLFMRRPKGRVTYHVVEYQGGFYGQVISMGSWS